MRLISFKFQHFKIRAYQWGISLSHSDYDTTAIPRERYVYLMLIVALSFILDCHLKGLDLALR